MMQRFPSRSASVIKNGLTLKEGGRPLPLTAQTRRWKDEFHRAQNKLSGQNEKLLHTDCEDGVCDPIRPEMFIFLSIGLKELHEFCRMRLFNTLFSWEGLSDDQREVIWPKLLRVEDFKRAYDAQFYHSLVNYKKRALPQLGSVMDTGADGNCLYLGQRGGE